MAVIDSSLLAIPSQRRLTSRPVPRRFRPDIQGMRAIAILTVAFYHAHVPFLSGGYVGVDVFFVISGFLITRQLFEEASVRGRVHILKFYSQRLRRLLPPIVLVVTSSLVLAHYVLPYAQLKSLVTDVYYASFYGINYHFAAEGVQYQAASLPPSALQHFWSLAVEEQFYVFWPFLITVCAVLGRRRFRRVLTIGVIAVLSAATLYLSVKTSGSDTSMAYFSLQTRAWELGAGALVALTASHWAAVPAGLARVLSWVGLGAIVVTALVYTESTVYPGWAAAIPVAGAALLIGAGVQRNSRSPETALLERPFMQYIGKVSYAWYLWHWPMLMLLPAWLGRPLHTWENLEVVGLAFWFAVLTYFLENAAHRSTWSTRKWAGAGILLSASVALVALVVGALMPNLVGKGGAVRPLALVQADQVLVGNAVRDSLAVRLVPKNLTPTLVTAPKDVPHTPRDDCFASLLMTTSEQCTYGAQDAPASQTAVLVGDSHAAQWLEALALDASEQNWKVIQLTKAACPIADIRTWQQDLGRDYSECTAFRHYVEGEVARIKPALIIGSQANILADGSVTAQRWADSTLAELSTLAGGRSRIAFIGDSTQTRTNTVDCLAAHLDDAASCAYSRSTGIWSIDRYRALAATLSNAGVGYVDTMGFFCAESYCPALVNNMLVHRDEGHITNTYAMWLRPMLNPIFQGASRD